MRKFIPFLIILILPLTAHSQWNKRYRWEAGLNLGASNFLGDLGGANQIGTHFLKDFEFSLTKPAVGVFMRYRPSRYVGFRSSFFYAKVSGDDALTMEKFRHNRNLSFVSNVFEYSFDFEFFFTKERPGHIYHYKKLHGWRHLDIQAYFFAGAGVFHFNPKAYYAPNKQWYALQPLRTEGEGLRPNTKPYSLFSVSFPIGAGFKYALNKKWSIGMEYGIRYTLTDYIDDCSTTYYDKNEIAAAAGGGPNGAVAAYFADPSLGQIPRVDNIGVTDPGQQRGQSKYNDAYMFMTISVNYKINHIKKTHSKF